MAGFGGSSADGGSDSSALGWLGGAAGARVGFAAGGSSVGPDVWVAREFT